MTPNFKSVLYGCRNEQENQMYNSQSDANIYQRVAADLYDMAMRCVSAGEIGFAKRYQADAQYYYDKSVKAR